MEEGLKDRMERNKIKANRFKIQDKKVFIVDANNTYYFCEIIMVGDEGVHVKSFAGEKKGEESNIYWEDVHRIDEYRERVNV